MSITITLEATRLKCPHCEHLFETGADEVELATAYECVNCGTIDEERRCPDCNIFKAKAEGGLCPECSEVIEDPDGEEVFVITCVCHDEEHEVYA